VSDKELTNEEKQIVEGWARVAEEYEPRELNPLEKAQVERAELEEKLAKTKEFTLK
jgi:hypothetical protein